MPVTLRCNNDKCPMYGREQVIHGAQVGQKVMSPSTYTCAHCGKPAGDQSAEPYGKRLERFKNRFLSRWRKALEGAADKPGAVAVAMVSND